MRYFLALLLFGFAAQARAEHEIVVLKQIPLADLLAEREATSLVVAPGGTQFLASIVLDDNWDVYFQIKQKESGDAGVWKEDGLKDGVVFKYLEGELKIKEEAGDIILTDERGNSARISSADLFDLLYAGSSKITFNESVTYAVIRNLAPVSGNKGLITLRKGSDGLYYYSLTPDAQVLGAPRWLLAIDWVLYGLRVTETDAVFLSKAIDELPKPLLPERELKF
jgi:hypothetical protein